jgi:hypothetical protein
MIIPGLVDACQARPLAAERDVEAADMDLLAPGRSVIVRTNRLTEPQPIAFYEFAVSGRNRPR